MSEGKLREAISHFKRALTLKPTPEMYYLVGRAYLEDGRTDIALRHLRSCVELDPRFDAALYHLGLIYLRQDEFDAGTGTFQSRLRDQSARIQIPRLLCELERPVSSLPFPSSDELPSRVAKWSQAATFGWPSCCEAICSTRRPPHLM